MILSRKTRPPIGLTVGDEILHESGEKVETGARFGAHPDVNLSGNAMVSLEAQSHKLSDNVPLLALLWVYSTRPRSKRIMQKANLLVVVVGSAE
jgi:hypothetical protein